MRSLVPYCATADLTPPTDTWHLSQFDDEGHWQMAHRDLELAKMGIRRATSHANALQRGELYPLRKRHEQRLAHVTQRACDEAREASVIFLPQLKAAAQMARASWAHEPMPLQPHDYAQCVAEVQALPAADSVMRLIALRRAGVEQARENFLEMSRHESPLGREANKEGGKEAGSRTIAHSLAHSPSNSHLRGLQSVGNSALPA